MKSTLYHGSPNIIDVPQIGKGNPKKISMHNLESKVNSLPKSDFGRYSFKLTGLSIEDM